MRRSLALEVLACPSCGGRLRLIPVVDHPSVVARILGHLAFPNDADLDRRDAPGCGRSGMHAAGEESARPRPGSGAAG